MTFFSVATWRFLLVVLVGIAGFGGSTRADVPTPKVGATAVDWLFVYKFNAKSFPQCGGAERSCRFGGDPTNFSSGFGLQYAYASSGSPTLQKGDGCLGDTTDDPVGATFDQIYNGSLYFVVWNDQFYGDPAINGCGTSCSAPWGHSKGVLAWDDSGNGVVLQVTTPSWPGAGNQSHPRADGNTLGCVSDDNDVLVAQDFFAARLTPADVVIVARALANASVVTNPGDAQIVKNGGPSQISNLIAGLGKISDSDEMLIQGLSTGIRVISKPNRLQAPPWQLVSSILGSPNLLVASWWKHSDIPDTSAGEIPDCWPAGGSWRPPGAVVNAQSGHWDTKSFSLLGSGSASGNHAKIGVTTSGSEALAIFGDMNQEGALSGNCGAQQNGRGGMFFVVKDQKLHDSVQSLISNGPGRAAAH